MSTRIIGPLGYKRFLLVSSLRTLFSRERALACSESAPLEVRTFVLLPAIADFVFSDVFEVEHACNRASPIRHTKHVQLSRMKFRAARCIILYSFTETPRLLVPTIVTGMPVYALFIQVGHFGIFQRYAAIGPVRIAPPASVNLNAASDPCARWDCPRSFQRIRTRPVGSIGIIQQQGVSKTAGAELALYLVFPFRRGSIVFLRLQSIPVPAQVGNISPLDAPPEPATGSDAPVCPQGLPCVPSAWSSATDLARLFPIVPDSRHHRNAPVLPRWNFRSGPMRRGRALPKPEPIRFGRVPAGCELPQRASWPGTELNSVSQT